MTESLSKKRDDAADDFCEHQGIGIYYNSDLKYAYKMGFDYAVTLLEPEIDALRKATSMLPEIEKDLELLEMATKQGEEIFQLKSEINEKNEMLKQAVGRAIKEVKENKKLEIEIERLNKILKQEFSENDELGAEYLGITMVREENRELKAKLDKANSEIERLLEANRDHLKLEQERARTIDLLQKENIDLKTTLETASEIISSSLLLDEQLYQAWDDLNKLRTSINEALNKLKEPKNG